LGEDFAGFAVLAVVAEVPERDPPVVGLVFLAEEIFDDPGDFGTPGDSGG
jgi:hypothetical protein